MPLGMPEIVREGNDITVVTYGTACRCALEAAEMLKQSEIEAEIIDVQTLLPFDRNGRILESLKKTSRILFLDEDVPGGATAYMMQQVIEGQGLEPQLPGHVKDAQFLHDLLGDAHPTSVSN